MPAVRPGRDGPSASTSVTSAPRVDLHARLLQQRGQGVGDAGQPSRHVPAALAVLDRRDAAQRRRRPVRAGAGVGRVTAGVLAQARIAEEAAGQAVEGPAGRDRQQVGQAGLGGRPGERSGEEGAARRVEAPARPVVEGQPVAALAGRETFHLGGHPGRVAIRRQRRAVGEAVAAQLREFDEIELQSQVGEDLGQGQQGGTEGEGEAVAAVLGELAAQPGPLLVQAHPMSLPGQQQGGDHASDPAADHDHFRHPRLRVQQGGRACHFRHMRLRVSGKDGSVTSVICASA